MQISCVCSSFKTHDVLRRVTNKASCKAEYGAENVDVTIKTVLRDVFTRAEHVTFYANVVASVPSH